MKLRSTSPRIALEQGASLIDAQGRSTEVLLVDLSIEGFRVRAPVPIATQAVILRAGKLGDARIALKWARGNEAGGVFLDGPPELN